MKVLLLPLDERPCNRVFPQMIAASNDEVELVVPPLELLGDKKRPADVAGISAFLTEQAAGCDAAVLSLDMLHADDIQIAVGVSWRRRPCNIKEQFDEADKLMYKDKSAFYSTRLHDRRRR